MGIWNLLETTRLINRSQFMYRGKTVILIIKNEIKAGMTI